MMKKVLSDEVLARIQEIVTTATGAHIGLEAAARLHDALSSDPAIAETLVTGGKSSEVTVLLTDLHGFTAMWETSPARSLLELLNRYLARMCEIAIDGGGTIDKFMGDAIMILFGAPKRGDADARHAVACAVKMQVAMDEMRRDNASRGLPPLYMGVGINTGEVIASRLGSELHSEYTVIGEMVNVASRIESFTLRGQILIAETTYDRCGDFVTTGAPMDVHVKGKSKPVRLREVLAIPSLGLQVPRQDVRSSPRVEVRLPFSYQILEGKTVLQARHAGTVRDLGYHGILAEVAPGLTQHMDIVLKLDLSMIGSRELDIYAKVLNVRQVQDRNIASVEFTSISKQGDEDIRRFVQLLIQGSPTK